MQLTLEHHGLELHRALHMGFVSINIQSALGTSGFLVLRFKQQWIKKSIFHPCLGIRRGGGPTLCTVLHHFISGT